jgi:hypothetical protein
VRHGEGQGRGDIITLTEPLQSLQLIHGLKELAIGRCPSVGSRAHLREENPTKNDSMASNKTWLKALHAIIY